MRKFTLTLAVFALVSFGGVAFAQHDTQGAAVKATPIEKVLDANPEPDGKVYRIRLLLMDGTQVVYEIPLSEAVKIVDGLSKPVIAGGQNRQFATIASSMTVQIDSKGEVFFLILAPRSRTHALAPIAIPISSADPLVKIMQEKIAEAKSAATKQPKQP